VLRNLEIVVAGGGEPSAVFDVSAEQLLAASFAVSHHLRWRFGGESLGVEETLVMRALVTVGDQLETLVAAGAHGTVSLGESGGELLHEAVSTYVTMRDLESHQSTEERARLTVLGGFLVDLGELCVSLAEARDGHSDQPLCAA
jgi:hypothetical protein